MKNSLNALWNIFPKNPVQTRFLRFLKTPGGEIQSAFTDSVDKFNQDKDLLKTRYSHYLGEL